MNLDLGSLTSLLKLKPQTWLGITAGAVMILVVNHFRWLPEIQPLESHLAMFLVGLAAFGFLVAGSAAVASIFRFFAIKARIARWFRKREEVRALKAYLPHMTSNERLYLGYLLETNAKSLWCHMDGGNLATLIARGIIVQTLGRTPTHNMLSVPAVVPDHIWEVLQEHRDLFPKPTMSRRGPPWFDSF